MFFLQGHSTRRVYRLYGFTKFQQITRDSHLCLPRLEACVGGDIGAPSGVVTRIPGGACRNSGGTISPCLFFWQAVGKVVEERGQGRALSQRQRATVAELRFARTDTSNLIRCHFTCTRAHRYHNQPAGRVASILFAAPILSHQITGS